MARIELPYFPREQFVPFHDRTHRWAVLVVHRRAGKTTALIADMVRRAILGPANGRYGIIMPQLNQAKSVGWDWLKKCAYDITQNANESELRVDLINGSRIRLFGADRYENIRGNRFDGVALDEYADIAPAVFEEVIRPALSDLGKEGWAVFSGTPKGRNHFHELWERAINHDDYFTLSIKASESGLVTDKELSDARDQMSPEVYEQEYECSWVAPRSGSYYGDLLNTAETQGRIGNYTYDPDLPVECAFDLGFTDSTSVWYWQTQPDGFRIIDFDEADSKTIDWWVDLMMAKGYKYSRVWLPHDARAKSFQTGKSTIEQLLNRDVPCKICPELTLQHGIDAVKLQIPKWYFNEATTRPGIEHLRAYHRAWNEKLNVFSDRPVHDSHSHAADAARYMALVQKHENPEIKPERPLVTALNKGFSLEVLWSDRDYQVSRQGNRI